MKHIKAHINMVTFLCLTRLSCCFGIQAVALNQRKRSYLEALKCSLSWYQGTLPELSQPTM